MRSAQRGFSLLELAVVIGTVGVLAAAAVATSSGRTLRSEFTELALQQRLAQAVIAFAQRNHRLPCPDSNGNGLENCTAGVILGGVPFQSLEVSVAGGAGSALARSYMYGVYRQADADAADDADLAVLKERTSNEAGDLGYLARNDLVMALRNAHRAARATTQLMVAPLKIEGAETCVSKGTNVAFALVYAGQRDADRVSPVTDYDGANGGLVWPHGSIGTCIENPSVGRAERYDDTVIAVSFTELLGYLIR
jgi:prepilin-type N-terminal cleavage/methylation domain-containing protein